MLLKAAELSLRNMADLKQIFQEQSGRKGGGKNSKI